jgi:hypothetical protein
MICHQVTNWPPADLLAGVMPCRWPAFSEIELRQIPPIWARSTEFFAIRQPSNHNLLRIARRPINSKLTADFSYACLRAQSSHLPDYTVFVQLLKAETQERLAGVDTPPQKGEWPTSRWVRGEVVVDEYLVAIPPNLPAGFYEIIAGFYRPETGQRLTLANGQDHWLVPWTYIK